MGYRTHCVVKFVRNGTHNGKKTWCNHLKSLHREPSAFSSHIVYIDWTWLDYRNLYAVYIMCVCVCVYVSAMQYALSLFVYISSIGHCMHKAGIRINGWCTAIVANFPLCVCVCATLAINRQLPNVYRILITEQCAIHSSIFPARMLWEHMVSI